MQGTLFTTVMNRVLFFWILVSLACGEPLSRNQFAEKNDEEGSPEDQIKGLKHKLDAISQQVMLQQFFTEERVRSDGQSGLKQVRTQKAGTENYFAATSIGGAAASIHDHANNIRTVGMGEFAAVLNGIEFRTRHNDYRLYKPVNEKGNDAYNKVEEIPFPKVPDEVKEQTTVDGQIEEMRQFFLAWKNQDPKLRDYRPYFKPVLCYLEGAWTKSQDTIDEPFFSDRHFIDAKSWFDLMDKVRFTSYTGSKSRLENFSFLPTKIMGFSSAGVPEIAQWNYRIACHELKQKINLARLRPAEDLKPRLKHQFSPEAYLQSRQARFQLNPKDEEKWYERLLDVEFLDKLMAEIPGKDNYPGEIYDDALDAMVQDIKTGEPKNTAYYHSWYKVDQADAMGLKNFRRGFSDPSLFMAATKQDKIAGLSFEKCVKEKNNGLETCTNITQRYSYAIPLEIMWLTPLLSWNPYDLEYKGEAKSDSGKTVTANERSCDCDKGTEKMLDGINSKNYYMTPMEFFEDDGSQVPSPADTARGQCCVLDTMGNKQTVTASGTRVILHNIPGVGKLRLRYPIFPIHEEGGSVWKELSALKDLVFDPKKLDKITLQMNEEVILKLRGKNGDHEHLLTLTPRQVYDLKSSGARMAKVTTETTNGHTHVLEVKWLQKDSYFFYNICDDGPLRETCPGHGGGRRLYEVTSTQSD